MAPDTEDQPPEIELFERVDVGAGSSLLRLALVPGHEVAALTAVWGGHERVRLKPLATPPGTGATGGAVGFACPTGALEGITAFLVSTDAGEVLELPPPWAPAQGLGEEPGQERPRRRLRRPGTGLFRRGAAREQERTDAAWHVVEAEVARTVPDEDSESYGQLQERLEQQLDAVMADRDALSERLEGVVARSAQLERELAAATQRCGSYEHELAQSHALTERLKRERERDQAGDEGAAQGIEHGAESEREEEGREHLERELVKARAEGDRLRVEARQLSTELKMALEARDALQAVALEERRRAEAAVQDPASGERDAPATGSGGPAPPTPIESTPDEPAARETAARLHESPPA